MKRDFDGFPLIETCDKLAHRCSSIAGTQHGSAWLWGKLVRYFESEPSAESVTIPCYYNCVGYGTAEIHRDGKLICRLDH